MTFITISVQEIKPIPTVSPMAAPTLGYLLHVYGVFEFLHVDLVCGHIQDGREGVGELHGKLGKRLAVNTSWYMHDSGKPALYTCQNSQC